MTWETDFFYTSFTTVSFQKFTIEFFVWWRSEAQKTSNFKCCAVDYITVSFCTETLVQFLQINGSLLSTEVSESDRNSKRELYVGIG